MKNLIPLILICLCSCTAPKFAVVDVETPDNSTHNCLITAVPLNKPAYKMSQMGEITILMGDNVKVKDTLKITRKHFTNY